MAGQAQTWFPGVNSSIGYIAVKIELSSTVHAFRLDSQRKTAATQQWFDQLPFREARQFLDKKVSTIFNFINDGGLFFVCTLEVNSDGHVALSDVRDIKPMYLESPSYDDGD